MGGTENPPVSALPDTGSVYEKFGIYGGAPRVRVCADGAVGEVPVPNLSPKKEFLLKVLLRRRGGRGAHFFPLTVSEGLC
jgi:hypothetical protein